MSIVLNGTTQYAWQTAPFVARPFSVAAWFKSTSDSALQAIWGEAKQSTTLDFWRLGIRGNAVGDPVGCYVRRAGAANATTSTGYTANKWHHALFIEAGSQDHRVYIDGGSEGTDTSNDQTPLNVDKMSIGALAYNNTWVNFFAGKLAEVAIWNNTILTDQERAYLANGVRPSAIRPANLAAYWKLEDDYADSSGNGNTLTGVASPTFDGSDHPTIIESASTGWPDDRPASYDPNLYWDEETGAWGSTRVAIPGAFAEYLVAVGEEGAVYFRGI